MNYGSNSLGHTTSVQFFSDWIVKWLSSFRLFLLWVHTDFFLSLCSHRYCYFFLSFAGVADRNTMTPPTSTSVNQFEQSNNIATTMMTATVAQPTSNIMSSVSASSPIHSTKNAIGIVYQFTSVLHCILYVFASTTIYLILLRSEIKLNHCKLYSFSPALSFFFIISLVITKTKSFVGV